MRTVLCWLRCRRTATERLRQLALNPTAGPRHRAVVGRHRRAYRPDWANLPTIALPTLSPGRAGNLTLAQAHRAGGGHW